MNVITDSPVHSSSSSDFAAFLDEVLDAETSFVSSDEGKEVSRKRRRVEFNDISGSSSAGRLSLEVNSEASSSKAVCPHPGFFRDLCIACGEKVDDGVGVAFSYIHKDLRLGNSEIVRLRTTDVKNLLRHKKLYLILDLDHTLLNSTQFGDLTSEEEYLKVPENLLQGSLFKLDFLHTMTKLRPFVHTFLREAGKMFEMYIYTMGERAYAHEMTKLLDPEGMYFSSRVISKNESTQRHQKGLDIVLGQESFVLILDDTEHVWHDHKENLILMERYHFFSSSCRQFGFQCKSLSELKSDEDKTDGALASVLHVLKQIYNKFFDLELGVDFSRRDVRQVLKQVKKQVLNGCKIMFSGIFSSKCEENSHPLWKMAEQLGATCTTVPNESVTHIITANSRTGKSLWAAQEKKFLVTPQWLEAANYHWRRHPEKNFIVL